MVMTLVLLGMPRARRSRRKKKKEEVSATRSLPSENQTRRKGSAREGGRADFPSESMERALAAEGKGKKLSAYHQGM